MEHDSSFAAFRIFAFLNPGANGVMQHLGNSMRCTGVWSVPKPLFRRSRMGKKLYDQYVLAVLTLVYTLNYLDRGL